MKPEIIDLSGMGVTQSINMINELIHEGKFPLKLKFKSDISFMNAERYLKERGALFKSKRKEDCFIIEIETCKRKGSSAIFFNLGSDASKEKLDYIIRILNSISNNSELRSIVFLGYFAGKIIVKKRIILNLIKLSKQGWKIYLQKESLQESQIPEFIILLDTSEIFRLYKKFESILNI